MHALLAAIVLAGLILSTGQAAAEVKLKLGLSPTGELATAFVAKDHGFFAKHGLDVDFEAIAINPNVPAALMSGSIQIGNIVTPTVLQAADNGLDLVIIGNVSQASKSATRVGLLARSGTVIKRPSDLEGKKVGLPSINGLFHVLLRRWMVANGVDVTKVQPLEVVFPSQADVLKSGNVDAVISIDPFLDRIIDLGLAAPTFDLLDGVPEDAPTQLYVTMRDWAAKNQPVVEAYRQAIVEAARFIEQNPDATRAAIGRYLKLPPPVLAKVPLPKVDVAVTAQQIEWWADVLKKQGMLGASFATAPLLLK